MYPQNPKGYHKYAPPPLVVAPPPPMLYPSLPPPVFPGNAMPPFPFPYGNGTSPTPSTSQGKATPHLSYPYGNGMSSMPPACPGSSIVPFAYPFPGNGNGIQTETPEKGIIPFPNKKGCIPSLPPSPGKGIGAYECKNGFPAAQPSPGANVVYFQRIGTGTSHATHETAWSTSLFGCFADFKSCLKTCFCPCITSGQIAEIVSEGKTSCLEVTIIHGLLLYLLIVPSIYTCHNRSKLRKRFKLKGNTFTDCLAHAFCCFCALCQEYRELYHQGYDPAIGWLKNVERDRNTVAVFRITPPVAENGMAR